MALEISKNIIGYLFHFNTTSDVNLIHILFLDSLSLKINEGEEGKIYVLKI